MFSVTDILKLYTDKQYTILSRPGELNIFGIRNPIGFTNEFTDTIGVLYNQGELLWVCPTWAGTTDPGKYYMENPMNVSGTAILTAGQHKDSHQRGIHKTYTALVQKSPLKVWRDNKRIDVYEHIVSDEGVFGIDIHRASEDHTSKLVDNFSAGCQVIANPNDFEQLMKLVDLHINAGYGNSFTYTLFE